jgi:eukaryotic-like serine/threonine-protein kinase
MTMLLVFDHSWLGPLAFAGLALCWLAIGWVCAREIAAAARPSVSMPSAANRAVWLGSYLLAEKIGAGAMGEVYRAYHCALGTWRAVKLLPRDASERERERFEKEARLGAELRHPNAVSIYEQGEADGTSYYAMELVDGVTLGELVDRQGPQSPERVVQILQQVCAALGAVHDKGLVHRDIKPDNVLLTTTGQAKLIDFGLVERIGEMGGGAFDAVVGTPLYISPEAILAPETVGARSDLYGLGAVAYFLLTGSPVFRGGSVVEVCGHHLHTSPERLSAVRGDDLPAELEQIVLDCLAKDPARRPRSAVELNRRLALYLVTARLDTVANEPSRAPSSISFLQPQCAFEGDGAMLTAQARTEACQRAA